MSKTIVVICVIMLCEITFAQWEPDVRLTNDPALSTGTYNNGNKVAVSGNIVHVVWHDERAGSEIYYTRSTDGGATWPASPAGDARLTNATGTSNYAAVAAMGDKVHVVWEDYRDGNSEIYYTRSTDGGVTWPISPAGDIRLTTATLASEYPSIAVSSDTVHVVWEDQRDNANCEIYYKRSVDGGTTWGSDTRLTINDSISWWPSIAVLGNNVHVVWREKRDGNHEIYYKRSTDGGTTWPASPAGDIRLTTNTAESWNPSVAVSGETVHVVWSDNRISSANYEIYYKRSIDNGTSWGADTRLTNATGASHFPTVAVEGSNVHVVWQDPGSGSNNDIHYMKSSDNGTTWSIDTNLTNVSTTTKYLPGVAAKGGKVHVVWRDLRDGNSEMYYKRYIGSVYYTITATAFGGGTIIPSGVIIINLGGDTTFIITPNSGHHLDSLIVDGVNHGVDSTSYRFTNVTTNHLIYAYFSTVPGCQDQNDRSIIKLSSIHPNPFRSRSVICYTLTSQEKVLLLIYDVSGKLVRTLINQNQTSGIYSVVWDGKDNIGDNLPNGIYVCQFKTRNQVEHRQLILVK